MTVFMGVYRLCFGLRIYVYQQASHVTFSSSYNTPIALKTPGISDTFRDSDMASVEDCAWETVGERLCIIFNTSNPEEQEKTRLEYVCELERTLERELRDARK